MKDFDKYNDAKIIALFNSDVGHGGWTSGRAEFLESLRVQFIKRGFDTSEIIKGDAMSLRNKVILVDKRLIVE